VFGIWSTQNEFGAHCSVGSDGCKKQWLNHGVFLGMSPTFEQSNLLRRFFYIQQGS
jgi:hypothetical protein